MPDHGGPYAFSYDFLEPSQAGTFWYHSHVGTQYCDGLRGPLMVYDPWDAMREWYDVDDGALHSFILSESVYVLRYSFWGLGSTIVSLMDWYVQAVAMTVLVFF